MLNLFIGELLTVLGLSSPEVRRESLEDELLLLLEVPDELGVAEEGEGVFGVSEFLNDDGDGDCLGGLEDALSLSNFGAGDRNDGEGDGGGDIGGDFFGGDSLGDGEFDDGSRLDDGDGCGIVVNRDDCGGDGDGGGGVLDDDGDSDSSEVDDNDEFFGDGASSSEFPFDFCNDDGDFLSFC